MKRYIHKAIDFGVESGYLIPKDAAYKVLRVSSDLMNDGNYSSKLRKSDSMVSQAGEKSSRYLPIRFEDYEAQDASRRRRRGRKRSRRRRSRSRSRRRRRRSRRRGRRRGGSPGGEEVVDIENDDEYNSDAQGEKRKSPDKSARNGEKEQLNQSDGEKTTDKKEDDGSDMSMDEDESDVEEEKKREDATKS
ncbi:PREDICTED: U1 small nuclear ribonucleoprotein 70 kDa-like [Eufriesea mexicana]|uniref:U1 small nuclear ribonucleoprotein 70 kDa-like n=1 Tax=Eufriesea mexicana TaxID=516756 RepID=UPI00083BD73D|nr:PREDICTED: U1 small nuclear ribonucleoprotein 70 kDa-like [Eufriesea mexicana]